MLDVRLLYDGFYALEDARVRQFLIVGEERALLFDAGFADSGVRETLAALTDLPVDVVMTHGDRDHSGGLVDFGACRLHEGDWSLVPEGVALSPLCEGDVIACGRWRFEVIEVPGHTAGSVAFYDAAQRLLLSGDVVQLGGPIYMFGARRDLTRYIASLKKLAQRIPSDVTVLPCHDVCPVTGEAILRNLADARALAEGKLASEAHAEMPCRVYHGASVDYLYDGGNR